MPEEIIERKRDRVSISPREVIFKYIRYLPWLILSVAILLALAYLKLRYSTPVYNVSAKLLVSQVSAGGTGEKFDEIFMGQRSEKINDEIEIIKSRSIAGRVVKSLKMQTQVLNQGKIRSTIVYSKDIPFNFEIVAIPDSSRGYNVLVALDTNDQFTLNEQPNKYNFNEVVTLSGFSFRISGNGRSRAPFASNIFAISWTPLEQVAASLSGSIGVNRVNDYTNVLSISYNSENTKIGTDIVNQYVTEYQHASLEDKREIAAKTLRFIDDQLVDVFKDLGNVENKLQDYRTNNRILDPKAQTELFFGELSENNKQLTDQGVRLKITEYLINYLSEERNRYKIVPTMLGIEEPSLLQQITEFNKLQLERESRLKNTGAANPAVLAMEVSIERLRMDMMEVLKSVKQTNVLTLNELTRKNQEANKMIYSMPAKEKQLLEVTRQQTILQELYSYLLQKKLETAIASASTISNIKVVENAMPGAQVSPNRKGLYIIALLIGIAIPAALIFVLEYLNDKIKGRTDIEQITEAPVLGEIGHADKSTTLVVTTHNRKYLAEQFRLIRSNLQYILPNVQKPIIMVTSSFSGEGKSFVSTNLGSVLALSGKKTVILEFDIRKPKIMKGLGLQERKGITNFIVGNVSLKDIIHSVPEVENLYVIPCGPVPPNPAEMLLHERVSELFAELRKQFDAVIVDTAPVGLVSDAISLGRHADATVYIVRHNYTLKKQIGLIDDIYQHSKLPHLSIIINDITSGGSYGSYYGYGGYGYGYGYGNGKHGGYFDSSDGKKKKGLKKWLSRSN